MNTLSSKQVYQADFRNSEQFHAFLDKRIVDRLPFATLDENSPLARMRNQILQKRWESKLLRSGQHLIAAENLPLSGITLAGFSMSLTAAKEIMMAVEFHDQFVANISEVFRAELTFMLNDLNNAICDLRQGIRTRRLRGVDFTDWRFEFIQTRSRSVILGFSRAGHSPLPHLR
jgi:hypothetical protein